VAAATKSKPVELTPAEEARTVVVKLRQAELTLSDRLASLVAGLADLEHAAGAATLGDLLGEYADDVREAFNTLARAQIEVRAVEAAIGQARDQHRAAILSVWAAEAVPLRSRAATLRSEADERQVKTDALLAELTEWEGCQYAPVYPQRPLADPGILGGAPSVVYVQMPRTQALRREADGLDQQATALGERRVVDRGSLNGETADELLALVRDMDPMQIGPTLADAEAWLRPAYDTQRARIDRATDPQQIGYGGTVAIELVWADGKVDQQRSRARVP
jgi:hypothetical protein